MSAWIAWRRSWAGAGAGAVMAEANSMKARSLRRMVWTSSGGNELDHVEQGFEMRVGEYEPPAILADPLDDADHVPLGVAAVAQSERLVAELERAEEDEAAGGVGKEDADRPLRSVERGQAEPRTLSADPAAQRRIGPIGRRPGRPRAELDRPAAIVAGREPGARQGRVGLEQRALAGDVRRMGRAGAGERVGPGFAPAPQPASVVVGGEGSPSVVRPLGGRACNHLARPGAGLERKQGKQKEGKAASHPPASSRSAGCRQKPVALPGRRAKPLKRW